LDVNPISWSALRVWLMLLAFAGVFVARAAAAWLWRAWRQRRRAPRIESRPAQEPVDHHDAAAIHPR
jgi:NhaP-type Na+/H+ or K+/H+ antiporter